MITGYNTDVPHNDVIFHVQTEDKGLANPFIESLVYVGGRVLVAKRASYQEILSEGSGEKEILALMDRQHRTMIAAIRHGKFDDKLERLQAGKDPMKATGEAPAAGPVPIPSEEELSQTLRASDGDGTAATGSSAAAVQDKTLDQVILEYLTNEAEQEQLVLLLEEAENLSLGEHAAVRLKASSSKSGGGVSGTAVTVKMISTASEPKVLAQGRAGDDGLVSLDFDIPEVARGTSALIITAASTIGRAELKQLL